MHKQNVVEESVEVLKTLRTEMHGSVESSVVEQLDQVIRDLELLQGKDFDREVAKEALDAFGLAIELAGLGMSIYQLVANSCG